MRKHILWLAFLLPTMVNAQVWVNGSIQRESTSGWWRGLQGANNARLALYSDLPAALSATSPLSYNSGTGVISIQQANGSQSGFLSSTDWNTFNNKQSGITIGTVSSGGYANGLNLSSGTLRLGKVSATNPGVLTTGTDTISGIKRWMSGGHLWYNGSDIVASMNSGSAGLKALTPAIYQSPSSTNYTILNTKAVVANCVVFVPGGAVGAVGVPVNAGDAKFAFKATSALSAMVYPLS